MKVTSLRKHPRLPSRVRAGSMLDIGAGRRFNARHVPKGAVTLNSNPEADPHYKGDARSLPFPDDHFEQVKASNLPYALLKGKNLERVLSEAYRVLQPGGKIRIDTEVGDPEKACCHSIKLHWLKEIPSSCSKTASIEELTGKFEEAGFKEVAVWKENATAASPYQKIILIAIKPESKVK